MIAVWSFFVIASQAAEISGVVVGVLDGDTIRLLADGKMQIVVRLSGIDAPEKKQPYGAKAREHLAGLIHEKEVRVVTSGKDRYGRTLGVVWVGETNVNEEMIDSGFAWQFRRYDRSKRLEKLEADAREKRIGLWADKEPVEPWTWRMQQREQRK